MSHSAVIHSLLELERRSLSSDISEQMEQADIQTQTIIGFSLDSTNLAANMGAINEALPVPDNFVPLPGAQNWVVGISSIRGDLYCIIDLRLYLGLKKIDTMKRDQRMLILQQGALRCALIVDEVVGLRNLYPLVESTGHHAATSLTPYLREALSDGDKKWHLFDFDRLISEDNFLNISV